ncbi:GNAT family N-acetyltransferase [Bacillus sp. AK031]
MTSVQVLSAPDIKDNMLDQFERYQETSTVLRHHDGLFKEEKDPFIDDWSAIRKREIVQHFRLCIKEGGAVLTASENDKVKGFAIIEPGTFGTVHTYRELSYIHISREARGKGIGRMLMAAVKETARSMGTDKLYIGAHPAVETQAFYRKLGCVPAQEVNLAIYNREKLDIQLELIL